MIEKVKSLTNNSCELLAHSIDASVTRIENIHNDSLLFRIWDNELKILLYPEFSELGVTFGESPDGVRYPRSASDFLFDICAWDGTRYIAEKCTGLHDNTSKLIYENDEFEYNNHRYRIIYIERNASFFVLDLSNDSVYSMNDSGINIEEITICGNIHNK